jgi:MFS superfamily sulfate permease-like transporter
LKHHGAIVVLGLVVVALLALWWLWAETLLEHLAVLALVVAASSALGFVARKSKGAFGDVARTLSDEQQ